MLRAFMNDEDQDLSRRLVGAMVGDGSTDNDDDAIGEDDDSEDDSMDSFQQELKEDLSSYVTDYHFLEAQLDWIRKHYGHSSNFLLSHGLKFYDDEDCRENKAIIQASW